MPNTHAQPSGVGQVFAVLGGLAFVASLLFFVASYLWRFDAGDRGGSLRAGDPSILVNFALFTAFALHHSIFARSGLKAWVGRVAPPALERSLYVWMASVMFIATCWWWQPVPGLLWDVRGSARLALLAGQIAAMVFTVMAASRLDVLELSGVRQVFEPAAPPHTRGLDASGPYSLVRHPIYLGWCFIVWLAPTMNGTRLMFAVVSCAYLFAAVPFEERDLRRHFGQEYADYARRVRWRILPFVY